MHDKYEEIYLKNQNLVYKFATNYKLLNDEVKLNVMKSNLEALDVRESATLIYNEIRKLVDGK